MFFVVVILSAALYFQQGDCSLFPAHPVAGQEAKPVTLHGAAALDQLKQEGQYESLQAAMRQARFSVSRAEATPLGRAAWHAPNPAAGYDAYVTEAGVSLALNEESYVSLSLHSLGYGTALQAVGLGEVSGDKQTINLTRDGGVHEWYVNGPDGLEQGFTLAEPPGARQQGVPLRLALQVGAGWRAAASDDGKRVTLFGAGAAVEYGKLVVFDKLGRNLPARLTVADQQVVIETEDHDAAYPLTIDPLFTLQQKLLAADGAANDLFGCAVALGGDTLVVGAHYDDIGGNVNQGSVYVFTRGGAGWAQQQKLVANDGEAGDEFGYAVAFGGDTLVVGALGDDAGANAEQGSVYVFTRSGVTWTQQQKLAANDGAANDKFGSAVALSGDTLAVGAYLDDIGANANQGSAYVFTRSGTVWTQQQKLTASDGAGDDEFGHAVALSGDTLAVGAHQDNIGSLSNQGSAYVFTRSGVVWTQQQKLTASDGTSEDYFGFAVALGGDTLAVGARGDGIGANLVQGSAYVFTRNGTAWPQQQKLVANDGAWGDEFGYAVAFGGDTLVVGAPTDDIGANEDQGSAYVFTRSGTVWTQQQKLTANDGALSDYFGRDVALSDDTVVVGATGDDIGANVWQGSVYAYDNLPCATMTLSPASLPDGASGTSYQQQMTVSGGAGSFQFALVGGALPPGLSLTANGLLAGTLTTQGTYQFTIRATSSSSPCTASRAYTMAVAPPCSTLTLDPPTLPNGAKGAPYSETLTATGGTDPYSFRVKGALPPGLSLSPDGVLSGTPTQTGNFKFTLLARDALGCVGSRAYNLAITRGGDIEISATPRANGDSR